MRPCEGGGEVNLWAGFLTRMFAIAQLGLVVLQLLHFLLERMDGAL